MTPLKYILIYYMNGVQALKNDLPSAVIVHGQEMPSREFSSQAVFRRLQ